jgi:beta-galactosidase/beta-glucuronidase
MTVAVAPGKGHDFLQDITITNPKLWDPNHPNLYTLDSKVKEGTNVVDDLPTRIGIRRIAWTHDGGLSINGVRYPLPGVNMHQEIYGLGDAVPDQAIYYDVKRIKDAGLDFIRGSHYPHSPAFYDACDELGIVVLDAQTGWQQYNDTPAFNANTFQELRDMIRRDRNHPSVVAWEASLNESNYTAAWASDRAPGISGRPGFLGRLEVRLCGYFHRRFPARYALQQRCAPDHHRRIWRLGLRWGQFHQPAET